MDIGVWIASPYWEVHGLATAAKDSEGEDEDKDLGTTVQSSTDKVVANILIYYNPKYPKLPNSRRSSVDIQSRACHHRLS